MPGEVTYHQQVVFCGKSRCRRCRDGIGHGPYWYAYQTEGGRTTRTYIGKRLPPSIGRQMPEVKEDQEAPLLRVWLLGGLRLERRASVGHAFQRVPELPWQTAPEARTLLAYLLSCPARRASLHQICEALWPQTAHDEAQARLTGILEVLSQVVTQARKRRVMTPLIDVEDGWVQLSDQSQLWVDMDAFEAGYAAWQQMLAEGGEERKRACQEHVLACYGGEFFPEERDAEWANLRRHLLHRHYTTVALDLADDYLAHGEAQKASDLLDRLLSTDPTNEAATQRLMIALAQQSRRLEALHLYQRFVATLRHSTQLSPQEETERLHERIVRGGPVSIPPKRAHQLPAPGEIFQAGRQHARQIGRQHQGPLVGREEEWRRLQFLLTHEELPLQEEPQVLLIWGEAGLGKTRLVEETAREAISRGWTVALGRVYAQESSIPYRLWTEALRSVVKEESWPREELSRRPLVFQPLAALLPELESLLPQVAFPSALPPEQEHLRLWEATRALLTLIAEGTPLLIALDDLQWADSSSCELLAYLARRVHGQPIVIVGTCREHELPANHPLRRLFTDLQRERAVESIALQPLSDEQIDTLVSSRPNLPERITRRIRERAAGNPFFAEELARSVEAQIMASSAPDTLDLDALLPETITAALDLRLERLSSACQRLLAKAAVLGGSFTLQVINEMETDTPNEDSVLDLLEEGLRSGMLTEEGVGTRITYRFWHPLLVSHLYERLSAARRASLHRRAADILRHAYQQPEEEQEHAATITHHLVHGGAGDALIVHYAELAGDHAYGLSSYPDAEHYYKIALERLPDTTEEQFHRAELLALLGECIRVQGNNEGARNIYEQALSVRNRLGASDTSQEAQIQAMLWCEMGLAWYGMGHIPQARACYQRGEQVLQAAGITEGPAWARLWYEESYCCWREGDYGGARRLAQEALRQFEAIVGGGSQGSTIPRTRLGRSLVGDPVDLGRTRMLLGMIASGVGETSEALRSFEEARALFERYDCQRELAIICCNLGDLYLRRAAYDEAQAALRQSLSLARQIGERPLAAFASGNLSILALFEHRLEEAEAWCKQAISLSEQDDSSLCLWKVYLASALREQDNLSAASNELLSAWKLVRILRLSHHTSVLLVGIAALRIAQATQSDAERNKRDQFFKRARKTAYHALRIEGSEAQTRIEARLILAQSLFELREKHAAQREAYQALSEARAGGFARLANRLHTFLDQIRPPGSY